MDSDNKYTKMQQKQYDDHASHWSLTDKDHVVGSFNEHNSWPDYDEFLFKSLDTTDKVALDFGCGPGRNIVKFANRFKQIDGIDISSVNLDKAKIWFEHNNLQMTPNLFKNNGVDLSVLADNSYEIIFSTICIQHIRVHEIRYSLFKEFLRVLKPGGAICIQMGFGPGHPRTVGYYDNNYEAEGTNSLCDTRIDNVDEIQSDLEKIGFSNFLFNIRPRGPGDGHNNWIFFQAFKP